MGVNSTTLEVAKQLMEFHYRTKVEVVDGLPLVTTVPDNMKVVIEELFDLGYKCVQVYNQTNGTITVRVEE